MALTVAIQDVLVPHAEIARDLDACSKSGINPVRFGLIPFTDDITCDDPEDLDRDAIPFGSVKIIRLWQQNKVPKSWHIFYDARTFDQTIYGPVLGFSLGLNYDHDTQLLGTVKHKTWKSPVFVKPANDLKAFAGMDLAEFAMSVARKWVPATFYALDVARTPHHGLKVVEFNCTVLWRKDHWCKVREWRISPNVSIGFFRTSNGDGPYGSLSKGLAS